jgi:hypothetical protein
MSHFFVSLNDKKATFSTPNTNIMKATLIALLVVAMLVSATAATDITQEWFTDSACSQGEQITKVSSGQCLLDSVDYSGLSWNCQASEVVAFVYPTGNIKCTGTPIAIKKFPQGSCVGPIYNDLYLKASGCGSKKE